MLFIMAMPVLAENALPFEKPWVPKDNPSELLEMRRTDGVFAQDNQISAKESAYSADSQV
jgi:hypothetical protein